MEWMTWLDWTHLAEMLIVPLCILAAALTVGIALNRRINHEIQRHRAAVAEETTWQDVFINALYGVPVSLCLVVGLYWIVNTIDIIEPLVKIFSYVLFTVIILSITRVVARTVSGVVDMQMQRSDKKMPKTTLLTAILNGVIYAMGVLVILQYYGISIAPILTALGVGGMAVALSLQETLANIFSGLHLIISKQIRIGDYIRLSSGEEGRVTDITWRFTTIIPAGESNMVVVPNKSIAAATIRNYSLPRRDIAVVIPIGVGYDSDLEQVERVTIEVATAVMHRVEPGLKKKPAVRFHTFGDSSIDFNVTLHTSRFDDQFVLKHEFIKAITKRYREENIDIPYPIQTVLKPTQPKQ